MNKPKRVTESPGYGILCITSKLDNDKNHENSLSVESRYFKKRENVDLSVVKTSDLHSHLKKTTKC